MTIALRLYIIHQLFWRIEETFLLVFNDVNHLRRTKVATEGIN